MSLMTVHTSWGDLNFDLQKPEDNLFLSVISAPESAQSKQVVQAVNLVDPNTPLGTHVLTRLASANKLTDDFLIQKLIKKIDALSPGGLTTAVELKKRAVLSTEQLAGLVEGISAERLCELNSMHSLDKSSKFALVEILEGEELLSENVINGLVERFNPFVYDDPDIVVFLADRGRLSQMQMGLLNQKIDISQFDLMDINHQAILAQLFEAELIDEDQLQQIIDQIPASDLKRISDGNFESRDGKTSYDDVLMVELGLVTAEVAGIKGTPRSPLHRGSNGGHLSVVAIDSPEKGFARE